MPPPREELNPSVMCSPESVAVTPALSWKTPTMPPPLITTPNTPAVIVVCNKVLVLVSWSVLARVIVWRSPRNVMAEPAN